MSVLVTLNNPAKVYSQSKPSDKLSIYYKVNEWQIDTTYKTNKHVLSKIRLIFGKTKMPFIRSVRIEAFASPEGPSRFNQQLSWQRAITLKKYIIDKCPNINPNIIETWGKGENWEGLRKLIATDRNLTKKEKILTLIDSMMNQTKSDTNRSFKERLRMIDENIWRHIATIVLPKLRVQALISVCVKSDFMKPRLTLPLLDPEKSLMSRKLLNEPITSIENHGNQKWKNEMARRVEILGSGDSTVDKKKKRLLAIKTNLISDCISALNVEMEVPIRNCWSVACEWTFPWWTVDNHRANSRRHRLQLLNLNGELKYWLGNRDSRPVLNGWFLGMYGGFGKYDFEYQKKGIQGELSIEAGISIGKSFQINRYFFMEYGLGLGYFSSNYRRYVSKWGADERWHPIFTHGGKYRWIGPTRLKISFGWIIKTQ